ncbi:hypothetical protein EIN_111900 [Entamoeba invadens IP1]|uniref:Uncharacterized protein n=1 Tax=Entamoeba invadens IP1 TaxID=370355 RepID=A0A0A1U155_ENTIV|nr:hypothetical protein EIN_111900 [Entamoeba invadens IP1]ELP86236.1 hypothetical protein EIN_111900 [Entamoeba invadens IP1]|eukprot:XP_004185582.1 hypothetical protein EIN_111900 [Entamoeba invadens IP1]
MFDNLMDSSDVMKLLGVLIFLLIMFYVNGFNKRIAKKLSNRIQGANSNFQMGVIGDITGYETQAKTVIDHALETFVRIGGNVMKTSVVVKHPTQGNISEVVVPIAQKYKLKTIGVKCLPNHLELRSTKDISKVDEELVVNNWNQFGDESQTFLKSVDQLILLTGKHEDKISLAEFEKFTGAKVRYDLALPNFMTPVTSEAQA